MAATAQTQLFSLQRAPKVLRFRYSWCLHSGVEEDRSTEGQLREPVFFFFFP